MTLALIVGPPNSGKAGAIRARLEASLASEPVLVVPTLDDADRFERELGEAAGAGALLGVSIRTFDRLFGDVAAATGVVAPPELTATQRLHVARAAIAGSRLRILARSATRPGFAATLSRLVDELQAAGVDGATLAASAAESGDAYLGELGALCRAYLERRDGLGMGDTHVTARSATAALRADSSAWGGRPVFVYGFDDLTVEQLELVEALARHGEVTVAVAFEDRRALAARARLMQALTELGGNVVERLEPEAGHTASATLFHLERSFLDDEPEPVAADDGLIVLAAAGERGQAEQIGAEIAHLIDSGAAPDEIAVVVRSPDREGPLLDAVLSAFGIPVAVDARVPFVRTATGRGLLALLRASTGSRRAEDVLAFVRAPGVASAASADWLERAIRRDRLRTASEALAAWSGRELFELAELEARSQKAGVLRTIAWLARRLAERPHQRTASLAPRVERLELRAAAAAAAAMDELAAIPGLTEATSEAVAALERLEIPLWRGPTDGHVRVTSPYRIRASRPSHLFVASLQEGEFPRHDAGEPLLSEQQRGALGLPPRADLDEEERYLFHSCLSRPTRRLYLCRRDCDDEGAEAARSPFFDDVAELLGSQGDPLAAITRRRELADAVLRPGEAPSTTELARAVAVDGDPAGLLARADGLDDGERSRIADGLESASRRRLRRRPGPLAVEEVVTQLRARELYGASTLEEYGTCSYRWFVGHELRPEPLDPEPEPLSQGSIVHDVLESLYRERPGGPDPLSRPATLGVWRARAAVLIGEQAARHGLGGKDARALTSRARMGALVDGLLEREAATDPALVPDRDLLEASFGTGADDSREPLELDGFSLHGRIDRVDVPAGGGDAALIRDYKVSRTVTAGAKLEERAKLQPQLYALALGRLWGRYPIGGLYQPLAATGDHRPRGIARASAAPALRGTELVGNDLLDDEAFDGELRRAGERAAVIVGDMRAGRITRDPIDDECPPYCTFQAICRRERALRLDPEPYEEGEAAG